MNNLEIMEAKRHLENTHKYGACVSKLNEFSYVTSSKKGNYIRHHFQQGLLKNIIFLVLSKKEQEEIEKSFTNKVNDEYIYFDSILLNDDPLVHHRFYLKGTYPNDFIFLNDDNTITKFVETNEDYDYE